MKFIQKLEPAVQIAKQELMTLRDLIKFSEIEAEIWTNIRSQQEPYFTNQEVNELIKYISSLEFDNIPDYNFLEELISSIQLNEESKLMESNTPESRSYNKSELDKPANFKGPMISDGIIPMAKVVCIDDESENDEYSDSLSEDEEHDSSSSKNLKRITPVNKLNNSIKINDFTSKCDTKKENTCMNSIGKLISLDLNPNQQILEGNLTLDDILQLNADKISKFHYTPKMNPRLRCIKEEENRFKQVSIISVDSDSPKNKESEIIVDEDAKSELSETFSENFNDSELTEFCQNNEELMDGDLEFENIEEALVYRPKDMRRYSEFRVNENPNASYIRHLRSCGRNSKSCNSSK